MAYFIQGALAEQIATTTALGGTTTLSLLSATYQKFTGTLPQTVVLPDATTMVTGRRFQIDSRTTGTLTINYTSGSFLTDILAYTGKTLVLVDNSTPNGVWTVSVGADTNEPFKLSQTLGTADSRLIISASQVRAEDGTTKTASPLGSVLPSFAETTIDFQTAVTTGGTVTRDGGAFSLPSTTIGQYRRVALAYDVSDNAIDLTFSAAAASQGALASPGTLFALISGTPLGYMDLVATALTAFKTAGSSASVIENFSIYKATNSGVPPMATATLSGLVSTTTQTFSGAKTFNDATTFKAASGSVAAGDYDALGQWTLGDAATPLPLAIKGSGASNLLTLTSFGNNHGIVEIVANVGATNNAVLKLTSGSSGDGIIRLGHAAAGLKIQNSALASLASMDSSGVWTFPVSIETPYVILTSGGTAASTKLTLSGTTWQIGGTASTITEAGNATFVSLQLTSGGTAASTKLTLSGTTWQIGGTASTITEAGVATFATSVATQTLQLTSGGTAASTKLTLSGTTWQIGGTASTITEAGVGSFATSVNTPVVQNDAASALSIQSAASQSILFAAGGTPAGSHATLSPTGILSLLSDVNHLCGGNWVFPTARGIESSVAAATLNVGAAANTAQLNLGSGANVATVNLATGAAVATVNIGTGAAATAINIGGNNDTISIGAAGSSRMHTLYGYSRISSPLQSPAISAGSSTLDFSLQHIFYKTGGSGTITLSNLSEGQTATLVMISTGAVYTITWAISGGGSIRWPAAAVPSPTSVGSRYDVYNFIKIGGITFGTVGLNFG